MDEAVCLILHGCNIRHTAPLDCNMMKGRLKDKKVKLIVIDPERQRLTDM